MRIVRRRLSTMLLLGLVLAASPWPTIGTGAAQEPVVVLLNAEPVSLDPMFTQWFTLIRRSEPVLRWRMFPWTSRCCPR